MAPNTRFASEQVRLCLRAQYRSNIERYLRVVNRLRRALKTQQSHRLLMQFVQGSIPIF